MTACVNLYVYGWTTLMVRNNVQFEADSTEILLKRPNNYWPINYNGICQNVSIKPSVSEFVSVNHSIHSSIKWMHESKIWKHVALAMFIDIEI